jgi:hypothetical protein
VPLDMRHSPEKGSRADRYFLTIRPFTQMTSTKIQNRTPTGPSHARRNQLWKSTSICTAFGPGLSRRGTGVGRVRRMIAQLGFLEGESFDRSSLLLTSTELCERRATLLAQFRSGVIETEELPDGYAFRLPGDCRWVVIIAEMIVEEKECCPFCPFLTFELLAKASKITLFNRIGAGPLLTKPIRVWIQWFQRERGRADVVLASLCPSWWPALLSHRAALDLALSSASWLVSASRLVKGDLLFM